MAKNCTEYRHFDYEIPILVKRVRHTDVHVTIRRLKIYDLLRTWKFVYYYYYYHYCYLLIAARIHTTVKSPIHAY